MLRQTLFPHKVRSRLLSLPEVDATLARCVASGRVGGALEAAVGLVQRCCVAQQGEGVGGGELSLTLEVLAKAAALGGPNSESLAALVEAARRVRAPVLPPGGEAPGGLHQPRRAPDPAGVREAVAAHLEEWARVCDAPAGDAMYTRHVARL